MKKDLERVLETASDCICHMSERKDGELVFHRKGEESFPLVAELCPENVNSILKVFRDCNCFASIQMRVRTPSLGKYAKCMDRFCQIEGINAAKLRKSLEFAHINNNSLKNAYRQARFLECFTLDENQRICWRKFYKEYIRENMLFELAIFIDKSELSSEARDELKIFIRNAGYGLSLSSYGLPLDGDDAAIRAARWLGEIMPVLEGIDKKAGLDENCGSFESPGF